MNYSFAREGKQLESIEITEMLGNMIHKNIIAELDNDNLEKFYLKLFDAMYQEMKIYLECKNYKIVNERQCFITGVQTKLIDNLPLWQKALENAKCIRQGEHNTDLSSFIKDEYYPEIKILINRLNKEVVAGGNLR